MLRTVDDVCSRLGLKRRTVYLAIKRGAIPSVRFGRLVRIPEEALEALERGGHPTLTKARAGR